VLVGQQAGGQSGGVFLQRWKTDCITGAGSEWHRTLQR